MDRTYSLSEYLFWRGDLSFSASGEKDRTSVPTAPFSEVDGLILSAMSYADFRGVDGEHVLPFPAAGIALSPGQLTEDGRKILKTDVQQFAEQLYRTRRFSELSLTGYVSETDMSAEQQFAAMTFLLPDKSPVVVFRGTDESLVGWKEDCNMSYLPSIPSQGKAVRYLNRIAARYPGDIHVVGHSKGGNLAIFASVGADPSVRARIRNVYSYDGPGFDESFVRSDAFSGVADRIVTFIPESSLVGGFFFRGGKTEYVLSAERGLMQHKPLSWYAVGDRLSRADGRSEFGKRMDDSIRNGIDTVPKEDRREFVELLFQLLGATKAETLGQLTGTGLGSLLALRNSYRNFDRETRQRFRQLFLRITALQREPKEKKTGLISDREQKKNGMPEESAGETMSFPEGLAVVSGRTETEDKR